jgi:hypothetical protein
MAQHTLVKIPVECELQPLLALDFPGRYAYRPQPVSEEFNAGVLCVDLARPPGVDPVLESMPSLDDQLMHEFISCTPPPATAHTLSDMDMLLQDSAPGIDDLMDAYDLANPSTVHCADVFEGMGFDGPGGRYCMDACRSDNGGQNAPGMDVDIPHTDQTAPCKSRSGCAETPDDRGVPVNVGRDSVRGVAGDENCVDAHSDSGTDRGTAGARRDGDSGDRGTVSDFAAKDGDGVYTDNDRDGADGVRDGADTGTVDDCADRGTAGDGAAADNGTDTAGVYTDNDSDGADRVRDGADTGTVDDCADRGTAGDGAAADNGTDTAGAGRDGDSADRGDEGKDGDGADTDNDSDGADRVSNSADTGTVDNCADRGGDDAGACACALDPVQASMSHLSVAASPPAAKPTLAALLRRVVGRGAPPSPKVRRYLERVEEARKRTKTM